MAIPGSATIPFMWQRRWLVMAGWCLVALLPMAALALLAAEHAHGRHEAGARARLGAELVALRVADALGQLHRELERTAQPGDVPAMPTPGTALGRTPAGSALAIAPEQVGGGGRVSVMLRGAPRPLQAHVDRTVFDVLLQSYPDSPGDAIRLVDARGTVIAQAAHPHERHGAWRITAALGLATPVVARHPVAGTTLNVIATGARPGLFASTLAPALAVLFSAFALAAAWAWLVRHFAQVHRRQQRLIGELESTVRALDRSQFSLREAYAMARLGGYEWDRTTDRVALSGEAARVYGLDPSTTSVALEDNYRLMHPEDAARLRRMAEELELGSEPQSINFRVVHPDGAVRHVLARGTSLQDDDGRVLVRGVVQDVSELVQANARLLAVEAQYRFLFEHNPLPMWVYDRVSLRILAVNDATLAHYGYMRDEFVGASILDIRPPGDAAQVRAAVEIPAIERPQGLVWTHLHKSGRVMRMAVFSHDIMFDGRDARLVSAHDVTDREHTEQRFRLVARATNDAVYDYDVASGALWWSEGFFRCFGYPAGRGPGIEEWASLVHPADRTRVITTFENAFVSGQTEWVEDYRFRRGDGTFANVTDRGFILHDETGRAIRMVGGMIDVSERQRYEEQLAYRATHDELTGLPNRQLLQDRLAQAILRAERHRRSVGLVFIDLDDFKLVNDSLGHTAGDTVLKEIGQRLQQVLRDTDTVARFGGDEFVVVLTDQTDDDGVLTALEKIADVLAAPIEVGDTRHTVTASIGWCRYPEGGRDAESLLMHGDLAMYQAKRQGRNRAVAFRPEYLSQVSHRLQLVGELREALEKDQFVLAFQPLFDASMRPVALEVLLRWQHPERGLLLPGTFIQVCEESGLIVALGARVLDLAGRHYRQLAQAGFGHLRIAVNVSPAQFNDALAGQVADVMRGYAIPSGVLELEITEGLLMANPEQAIGLMHQMVALGVTFAIDDFGTGYSSLAYLKRFPIDRLKIDRSFVRDLGIDTDDEAICNSIIGLARAMDIRTVAEGVETDVQLEWLHERRIDEVQGYLLGRPVPFEEVLQILRTADAGAREGMPPMPATPVGA